MKFGVRAALSAAAFCCALGAAHAQTLTLVCDIADEGVHFLAGGAVQEAPPESERVIMTIDFAANTLSSGEAVAPMRVTPERIIAIAQSDTMSGLYDIDRRTGAFRGIAHNADPAFIVFLRTAGQCRTGDGATTF